jgi:hypothetical protein
MKCSRFVGFGVYTVMSIKIEVFWVIATCGLLAIYQRVGVIY